MHCCWTWGQYSYKWVLKISAQLGDAAVSKYVGDGVVCPPVLHKGLFTTAAMDNIDHDPTATTSTTSFHGNSISLFQHPTKDDRGEQHEPLKERRSRQFQNFRTPISISVLSSLPKETFSSIGWHNDSRCQSPETTTCTWVWVAGEGWRYWWNRLDRECHMGSPSCFAEEKPCIWGQHHITDTSPVRSCPPGCYSQTCDGQDQGDCIIPEPRPSACPDCLLAHLCSGKTSPMALAWSVWWGQVLHHVWRLTYRVSCTEVNWNSSPGEWLHRGPSGSRGGFFWKSKIFPNSIKHHQDMPTPPDNSMQSLSYSEISLHRLLHRGRKNSEEVLSFDIWCEKCKLESPQFHFWCCPGN